jgi:hypothetical protein
MRRALLIGAVVVALSVVPLAYALLTQHGVKTTRLYKRYPAAASEGGTNYFGCRKTRGLIRATPTPT